MFSPPTTGEVPEVYRRAQTFSVACQEALVEGIEQQTSLAGSFASGLPKLADPKLRWLAKLSEPLEKLRWMGPEAQDDEVEPVHKPNPGDDNRVAAGSQRVPMKTKLPHPSTSEIVAEVGLDRAVGWFATVRSAGRLKAEYDAFSEDYDGLAGVLRTLVSHEFITSEDLAEALRLLPVAEPEEIEDPGVRHAADVVERLKMMGA